MPFMPSKEAKIRYRRRAIPALLLMVASFYGTHYAMDRWHPAMPVAVVLALLPPLSTICVGVLIMQFLNADRDEVQIAYRRHAISWATAGLLAVCVLWNGLGVYDLAPKVAAGMAFPVFIVFLIVALVALKRQYQ